MESSLIQTEVPVSREVRRDAENREYVLLRDRQIDRVALVLAVCAVPVSIAVSESLLAIALVARVLRRARGTRVVLPRVFWYWLIWAGFEVIAWTLSPELASGWGEMRRLLLIGALFFVLPAFDRPALCLTAWKGIFLAATLSSLFLIGDFVARLAYYRRELRAGGDISLYLRTGGLLNNWMVYGTVEILVVSGLISFWFLYPEERRRWWPVAVVNALAVVLSLTRMLWVCSLLLLTIELAWRRSKWFWALPLLPLVLYALAPGVLRTRVSESMRSDYSSNQERVEMLRVGWRMVNAKPLTGVGPGRVNRLYPRYLSAGEPLPAYHGHLHNNLMQLAAEFGLPVVGAALLFTVILFRDLLRASKAVRSRAAQFCTRSAILGLTGFLTAGLFDYTYGHSLGLILLAFAVVPPLLLLCYRGSLEAQDAALEGSAVSGSG